MLNIILHHCLVQCKTGNTKYLHSYCNSLEINKMCSLQVTSNLNVNRTALLGLNHETKLIIITGVISLSHFNSK